MLISYRPLAKIYPFNLRFPASPAQSLCIWWVNSHKHNCKNSSGLRLWSCTVWHRSCRTQLRADWQILRCCKCQSKARIVGPRHNRTHALTPRISWLAHLTCIYNLTCTYSACNLTYTLTLHITWLYWSHKAVKSLCVLLVWLWIDQIAEYPGWRSVSDSVSDYFCKYCSMLS